MTALAIILAILVVAVIVYFVVARKHPENAAGHDASDPSTSTELFGNVDDRPAGPGAEADGVAGPGQVAPGPSAESLPRDDV